MSDIKKKNGLLSVVPNHRLEYDHDMNWSETAILDRIVICKKNCFWNVLHQETM